MKAAIYSPYLDSLGGGERYMVTIGQILSDKFEVDVLLDKNLYAFGVRKLKDLLSARFGLNLEKVNFILAPIGPDSDFFERLLFLRKYKILFYLTDGSIFLPTSGKNILHIQSPSVGQPTKNLWGRIKLNKWDLIIYNSSFTKLNSEKNWLLKSRVVYPPVAVNRMTVAKKEKIILSVGRFFGYLKSKKHELLIDAFKELVKNESSKSWSLHLAGSANEGDLGYLESLKERAKGYSISFYPNLGYGQLLDLYGKSSIYWHAAGYKEENPANMEHFGIATVEAMAAGCVPVVINKGGQSEILQDQNCGFLWLSAKELVEDTVKLINNRKMMEDMSKKAISRAEFFSEEKFKKEILKIVDE